ncbi:MAG: hypothetical protein ABI333_24475 [bacterium]
MAHRESRFMANIRSKFWSILIVGVVLVLAFVLLRYVIMSPDKAKVGYSTIAGMPGWLTPIIMMALGAVVFWLGLKVRSDWPEVLGSGLIAGGVGVAEMKIGWQKFAIGSSFTPVLIPAVLFIVLIFIAQVRSR